MKYFIELNGTRHEVELPQSGPFEHVVVNGEQVKVEHQLSWNDALIIHIDNRPHQIDIMQNGDQTLMQIGGENLEAVVWNERQEAIHRMIGVKATKRTGAGNIKAPMPGLIVKLDIKEGDPVRKGQSIMIVEAMKMENEIPSPIDGVVKKCLVEEGKTVNKGDVMVVIDGDGQ